MNVGSPHLDGPADQHIHHANDRGLAGKILETLDIFVGALVFLAGNLFEDVFDRGFAGAVQTLESGFDFGRDAHTRQHWLTGE